MELAATDEKLLKALAVAMVDRPRGTFKDIAQGAGISKATLNRFCGTRDNLIDRLMEHGSVVMNRAIAEADLLNAPPLEALQRLIEQHLAQREILVFMIVQWRPDSMDEDQGGQRWLPYADALDAFFLRGQEQGVFRIDIAAPALTEVFASILFGLVDAERRGRVARSGMANLVETVFLRGASKA